MTAQIGLRLGVPDEKIQMGKEGKHYCACLRNEAPIRKSGASGWPAAIVLVLGFMSSGFSAIPISNSEEYLIAVRSLVRGVVQCENPEFLATAIESAQIDQDQYFKENKKPPVDFRSVRLGPNVTGYRAEVIPEGQGATGWKHAWLFKVKNKKLILVYELDGPYLFIDDTVKPKNGHYFIWHWNGSDLPTATKTFYEYKAGRYIQSNFKENEIQSRD